MFLMIILPASQAEETAEYRDDVYSFRYPASWTQGVADNGDIVLGPARGSDAAITFAIRMSPPMFTGDPAADGPAAESYIADYSGKNLALDGRYELVEQDGLHGFRAFGSWRATGQDAVMTVLSGPQHVVGFVMVGGETMTLTEMEQMFLDSLVLYDNTPAESTADFKRWQGEQFSLEYPEQYSLMEMNGGAVFVDPAEVDWTEGPTVFSGALTLYNRSGEEVVNRLLEVSYDNVQLDSVVLEATILPTRTYDVENLISTINQVAEGYEVRAIHVSPESVSVAARSDVLNQVGELALSEHYVDLKDLTETTNFQIKISKPSDDAILSNETITVTVEVAPAEGGTEKNPPAGESGEEPEENRAPEESAEEEPSA